METTRLDRELDTRKEFQRAEQWQPTATLPEPKKQPGWEYRWIRTSLLNQQDSINVSNSMREGWEPVKASDHPEMKFIPDPNSRFKDSIEIGGLLLCKIPEEFIAQRRAYYDNMTKSQTQAVDNNFLKENDARMPVFSDKKSTTSFGKGK
jgi:hypothetical protein